jgi:hypothetical protein
VAAQRCSPKQRSKLVVCHNYSNMMLRTMRMMRMVMVGMAMVIMIDAAIDDVNNQCVIISYIYRSWSKVTRTPW